MKMWMLDFEVDEYDNLVTVHHMGLEEMRSYDGRRKKRGWQPLAVRRMEPEKGLALSNAPGFASHIPVFDDKALEVLLPLIKNEVEVLPLAFSERNFYAINITTVLDCIDYDKSQYRTYSDGKRIMVFERYSFKEKLIKNKSIFKIIDEPLRNPFVSDEFRDLVISSGLTGFEFKLVWDSESKEE